MGRFIKSCTAVFLAGSAMFAQAYEIRAFEDAIKPLGMPVSVNFDKDRISEYAVPPIQTNPTLPSLCSDWIPTDVQAANPYLLDSAREPHTMWDSAKEWLGSNLFVSSNDMFSLGSKQSEMGGILVPNPWIVMVTALIFGTAFSRYRRAD